MSTQPDIKTIYFVDICSVPFVDIIKMSIVYIVTMSFVDTVTILCPLLTLKKCTLLFLHNIISGKICASLSPHLNYIPPSITHEHHLKNFKPNLHLSRYNQNFLSRTTSDWNSFSNSILLVSHPESIAKKNSNHLIDPYK